MAAKFPTLSLRMRLFVLTAVALAPALIILVYNEISLRRSREAEVHELALRFGQLAALEMESIVGGTEGLLRAVARAPVVRSFEAEACAVYLVDILAQAPHLNSIAAIDTHGDLRCRSQTPTRAPRLDDREYFKRVLKTGSFVVGEYMISRFSGKPALPLATPIQDNEGAVIGVLVGALDLDWLGRRLGERDLTGGSALTIADRNGVIIAREPFPERFIGTKIPEAFLPLVNAASPGTREVTSQDGTRRIIGYIPASTRSNGFYVSAGLSRDEAFAPIERATRRGAGLAIVGALIAFLSAWFIGRSVVRKPVTRLVTTIGAWRDGNPSARTGMSGDTGEIEAVGAAIDGLMDELEVRQVARRRAEERQQVLINELNHRVKNTLATVQSIVSQTLRNSPTPEAAQPALEARLIALAHAHDVLTHKNWEHAELGEILARAIEPYRSHGVERFRCDGPRVELSPQMSLALAMAFQELATNAVKYGALSNATGIVRVTWSATTAVRDGQDENVSERRLRVRWEERGGPNVEVPTRRGFGSRLIERSLAQDLNGDVQIVFAPTGVVCIVDALLE